MRGDRLECASARDWGITDGVYLSSIAFIVSFIFVFVCTCAFVLFISLFEFLRFVFQYKTCPYVLATRGNCFFLISVIVSSESALACVSSLLLSCPLSCFCYHSMESTVNVVQIHRFFLQRISSPQVGTVPRG